MTINAVRVSKTSFKKWFLYGPVDQALKTSAQCEQITCLPLNIKVHGHDIAVELWHNVEEASPHGEDELNSNAQIILQAAACREKGLTPAEAMLSGQGLPALPIVKGVAVLTGAGCTDFPEHAVHCVLATLAGVHDDEANQSH